MIEKLLTDRKQKYTYHSETSIFSKIQSYLKNNIKLYVDGKCSPTLLITRKTRCKSENNNEQHNFRVDNQIIIIYGTSNSI